jgi:hypothetical protein
MMSTADTVPLAPTEQHSDLVSFDNVLAKLPRSRPVRLYPVTARNNGVMWEAVQQAFAFFSTADGVTEGVGPAGSSTSVAAAAAAAAAATAGSSIQSLDLTQQAARRQQQLAGSSFAESPSSHGSSRLGLMAGSSSAGIAQSAVAAAAVPGSPAGMYDNAADIGGSSSFGTTSAATSAGVMSADRRSISIESPSAASRAAAAAAAAAASTQLFSALGSSIGAAAGLRSPPGPAVSGLNDILEIRTDVQPVRMISQPHKPPLVSSGHGETVLEQGLSSLRFAVFYNLVCSLCV